jgi:hypothetical protein
MKAAWKICQEDHTFYLFHCIVVFDMSVNIYVKMAANFLYFLTVCVTCKFAYVAFQECMYGRRMHVLVFNFIK